jgi:hypothetical protein
MTHRPLLTVMLALALASSMFLAGQRLIRDGAGRPPAAVAGTMSPDQSTDNSGATPDQSGATNPAPATATPAAAATPAPSGTVLASDNFASPPGGLFPASSPNSDWTQGYVNNEYQIATLHPVAFTTRYAVAQGSYGDVSVAVDAHLMAGSDTNSAIGVACRLSGTGSAMTGYRAHLTPTYNNWVVERIDPGNAPYLAGPTNLNVAPVLTQTHHLVLTCSGTTISLSVDGKQVSSVQDPTYPQGSAAIYARMSSNTAGTASDLGTIDARFDKFVLTQP